MLKVSLEIYICLSCGKEESVRILCSLSANFSSITRTSLAVAMNIFLRLSACCSSFELKLMRDSFVTPSTSSATSVPKFFSISDFSKAVSSTVSCSKAAAMVAASMSRLMRIRATFVG